MTITFPLVIVSNINHDFRASTFHVPQNEMSAVL